MKKKKQTNYFSGLQGMAVGLGGAGLSLGVAGGIASKAGAPAGITAGIATAASFAPVAAVGYGAHSVLKALPKKKRRY